MTAGKMQRVRLDDLEREVPVDHWGVGAAYVERDEARLVVQHCDMAPGGGAELHAHADRDQMFVVMEGTLRVRDGDRGETDVSSGEALKIPAGTVHATVNQGGQSASYLVLTYPSS